MIEPTGITPTLNYDKLEAIAEEQSAQYQQASPFPHVVLDNLFEPQLIAALIREFPTLKERAGQTPEAAMTEDGKLPQPNKLWLSNQLGVSRLFRHLYWELNSAPFLDFLERITGIPHLIPDPHLAGGGVHQTRRDGLLMIHADFNKHPHFQLDRRINFLLYLNENWQDAWGGHLELWERDMSQCVQRVAPVAGRCVIFSTTRDSFHGHPHPLTCPENQSRKSVALYYYTNGRPADEDPSPHKTIWKDIT